MLGIVARKYAHKIPFIVKINHNELLTYPNKFDQVMFGTVEEAYDMGAAAVGATIYFGSDEATRQIVEVADAFAYAHELGMATVLWCYLRNNAFKADKDYHVSADLTGQANHLGVTIQADIIKQKLPENNGGYNALKFGKTSPLVYSKAHDRPPDRPLPLPGRQLLHGPLRPDQLGRRIERRERPRRSGPHGRDQQARRRHGPDQRPQGVPAPDERRRRAAQRDPGRLPRHDRSRSPDASPRLILSCESPLAARPLMYPDPFTAADLADLPPTRSSTKSTTTTKSTRPTPAPPQLATAASPTDRSTLLVLADHQTAGRGRGTNQWWSAPGALTFSVLLRTRRLRTPQTPLAARPLTTGLAVCRAIESLDQHSPAAQIKWPNDIYLAGRKLGGILVEAATGEQGSIIIGIGLNINNSADPPRPSSARKSPPSATRRRPRDSAHRRARRVLRELADGLEELMSGDANWSEAFAARSLLTGRKVEIDSAGGPIEGICEGIDRDGALIVATPAGRERIVSGTVTRFD